MEQGLAQMRAGAARDAAASFSAAISSKTLPRADLVRAIYDRGVAYDSMGQTAAAIADYSAALKLDQKFAPALNNRANAFRRTNRLAEARRDYLAALKCPDASREYPSFGLGQIAEAAGDTASARDYYHQALAANPAFVAAAQRLVAIEHEPKAAPVQTRSQSPPPPIPARASPPRQPAPVLRQAIIDPKQSKHAVQIQLGAFRDEASASTAWDTVVSQSADVLRGLSPHVVEVDLPGKGRYWRLRADVPERQEARRICDALVRQGKACIIASEH
jgi:tetratricopeptide (TPR) repeat protein